MSWFLAVLLTTMSTYNSSKKLQDSFSFAADSVKQTLTLAVGVLGLSITLLTIRGDDLNLTSDDEARLLTTWILLIVSSVLAVATLQSMAGALHHQASPSIYGVGIVIFAVLHFLTFWAGLGFAVFFTYEIIT